MKFALPKIGQLYMLMQDYRHPDKYIPLIPAGALFKVAKLVLKQNIAYISVAKTYNKYTTYCGMPTASFWVSLEVLQGWEVTEFNKTDES